MKNQGTLLVREHQLPAGHPKKTYNSLLHKRLAPPSAFRQSSLSDLVRPYTQV